VSSPPKPLHRRLLGPPYRFLLGRLWGLRRFHPRRIRAQGRWAAAVLGAIRRRRREERLTVAVDVSFLWEPLTGIGWYLYRLLQHLAPRDDLALRLYGPSLAAGEAVPEPVVPLPEGPAIEQVLYPVSGDTVLHADRMIHLVKRLERRLIAADGSRVLFAPNYLPSARFSAAAGALVATVHDLGYRRVPWAIRQATLERLEAELDQVWFRAERIVTDSAAVRDEILAEGLAAPGRLRVIPLGPGQDPAQEPQGPGAGSERSPGREPEGGPGRARTGDLGTPAGLPPGYGLSVGTLEPRKNLETLLDAWRALRRRRRTSGSGRELPALVLCGQLGWKSEALRRRVEEARAEGWLHHVGYVEEAALAALYRGARLFVFPSRYEGFGLPVLEALAAGLPVVASDLPVLRELAGEAVLYAPAMDVEAWVRQLERVLDDPELACRLAAAGRERAGRFTWERAAEMHMAVFREAACHGRL
jgi:glycosyltransferase involved in cell wall biosynthesis